MATMPALPAGAEDYDTGDGFDEAFEAPGVVREHYLEVLESLAETGVEHAAQAVEARLREWSVRFGGEGDGAEFVVDPVPRLLTAEEWKELTTGLRQRVLALDAFVADMHGPRRAIADGVIPARVVEGSVYLEADLRGLEPVGGARIAIAGLDVVRDRDGRFKVLEDNVRTPSGSAYGLAASEAVEAAVPTHARHEAAAEWLRTALRRCMEATNPDVEGELVLLTDGPATPPGTSTSGSRRSRTCASSSPTSCGAAAGGSRCSTALPSARSTAAPTRIACATTTGSSRTSRSCCSSRCAPGRSAS